MDKSAWRTALDTGWSAAQSNRIPAIAMWIFGVAIVVGYFFIPPVHNALEAVGRLKFSFGWKFSLISTGIFGGLIPAIIAWLVKNDGGKTTPGIIISSTLLWAYKGVEIDLFYRFQAWLFGDNAGLSTILIKTFVDQMVMVPTFGMVSVVLFYHWRDCGYSRKKFVATLGKNWYSRRVLPVLIANWVIWIPAVAMIYGLPIALQLPVQNLILCFWVLILMFFTGEEGAE